MCGWVPHASSIRDAAPARSAVTLGCSSSPWPLLSLFTRGRVATRFVGGVRDTWQHDTQFCRGKQKTLRQIMINPEASANEPVDGPIVLPQGFGHCLVGSRDFCLHGPARGRTAGLDATRPDLRSCDDVRAYWDRQGARLACEHGTNVRCLQTGL